MDEPISEVRGLLLRGLEGRVVGVHGSALLIQAADQPGAEHIGSKQNGPERRDETGAKQNRTDEIRHNRPDETRRTKPNQTGTCHNGTDKKKHTRRDKPAQKNQQEQPSP